MHGNTIVIKKNYDKIKIKNTYVPRLFDKLSYLTKITLKKPLSRGNRFKIYFIWNAGEIEDRASISTEFLFQRPCTNKPEAFRIMSFNKLYTYLKNKQIIYLAWMKKTWTQILANSYQNAK